MNRMYKKLIDLLFNVDESDRLEITLPVDWALNTNN